MFTSKGLFSEIQCPYEETCVLPRCIFAHPTSSSHTAANGVSTSVKMQKDGGDEENRLEKPKRDSGHDQAPFALREPDKSAPFTGIRVGNDSIEGKAKRPLSALNRSVSPPPLRRKGADGEAVPIKQQTSRDGSRAPSTSSTSTPTKSLATTKTPVKVAIKKEGLNPRALKLAPAAHDMRFRLLRALHEQFKRLNTELGKDANHDEEPLVLSEQAVITMALDAEEDAASQPTVYSNLVKNKILQYKRMTIAQWKSERERELAKAKALEAASISDTPNNKSKGPPKEIKTGLTTAEEVTFLPRLITPIDNLSKHGYVTTIPTSSEIETARQGVEASQNWEICDRCKSRFQVFPGRRESDGALASGGPCTYHYGKPFWTTPPSKDPTLKREKKWRCCGESVGDSPGCTVGECHVFKITEVKRLVAVLNFEKTPENPGKENGTPICIDGEMGYTVFGLELIRLTATSWPDGDALFDVLLRPVGEILDLNTRYSGVHASSFTTTPPYSPSNPPSQLQLLPSISAARQLLFTHLSPSTPLLGHGLENDLNAVRAIHPVIIDTALLYPHKAGLPYRNGLKMLMQQYLNREIQVVVEGQGHDSKEDANAAGMLVRLRVGEEWTKMKRKGWKVEGGEFVGPGSGREVEEGGG